MHYNSVDDMPDGLRKLYEKQMAKQTSPAAAPKIETKPDGKRKYHNLPTERLLPNGEVIKFRSKKESAYYDNLIVLQKAGIVRDIRLEYQYLIKPAYTDGATGERFRAVSYLADFVYDKYEDGEWKRRIVDTKGRRTKDYIIKRKLLADMGIIVEEA